MFIDCFVKGKWFFEKKKKRLIVLEIFQQDFEVEDRLFILK